MSMHTTHTHGPQRTIHTPNLRHECKAYLETENMTYVFPWHLKNSPAQHSHDRGGDPPNPPSVCTATCAVLIQSMHSLGLGPSALAEPPQSVHHQPALALQHPCGAGQHKKPLTYGAQNSEPEGLSIYQAQAALLRPQATIRYRT